MPRCIACGDTLDIGQVVFRTRQTRCYVFQGDADDLRNGLKFHTRDGVLLEADVEAVVVPMDEDAATWTPPRREGG